MKSYPTHLITKATGDNDLKHLDGNTQDIIDVLLEADKKAANYTAQFAPHLKGKNLLQTCYNIWAFVKNNIPYKIDDAGYQWIKSPGRLWHDKKGDCKSFSLFIGSCLRNLGIPYGYRFTSYGPDATPTHVYVYVPHNGSAIILDAVWSGPFNSQKTYTYKKDYLMSKISYLGAASGQIAGTLIGLPKNYHDMKEGEFELYLAKQRLEIEKANAQAIGSPYASNYDTAIAHVGHAIANVDNPDEIIRRADAIIGRAKAKGKKQPQVDCLKKQAKQ